jgi:nucleoside-diphosphate-sugar epimerase
VRVTVFGATGNIGTALLRRLATDAEVTEVRAVARRATHLEAATTMVTADIEHDDLDSIVTGSDAVVHLAWAFHPTHHPDRTWKTNVGGTIRILEAVARNNVPALIYSSSVGAYAPGIGRTVDESWPTHAMPSAAYGREKSYLERVLDTFTALTPATRVVRLRPAFVFQRSAASEQRRIFMGPFAPTVILRNGHLPVLPYPRGLTLQVVHADDVASAIHRALVSDAHGAFNLAADPVIDGQMLGELLDARLVEVPPALIRSMLALAWHGHLVPAEPGLFDLARSLPTMSSERAQRELEWRPEHGARDTLAEAITGLGQGAGESTPPLRPSNLLRRLGELATGVGERRDVRVPRYR